MKFIFLIFVIMAQGPVMADSLNETPKVSPQIVMEASKTSQTKEGKLKDMLASFDPKLIREVLDTLKDYKVD